MTELEERLTNELSKLAAQYEQDQKAVGRGGRALGRTGARIGRELRAGGFQLQSAGERADTTQKGPPKAGRTHHEIDRCLRQTDQRVRGFRRGVQLARGGFERTFSLIHAEPSRSGSKGTGGTALRKELRALSKAECAAVTVVDPINDEDRGPNPSGGRVQENRLGGSNYPI